MNEQEYIIALNLVKGLRNIRIIELLKHFSNVSQIFKTSVNTLSRVTAMGPSLARQIHSVIETEEFSEELRWIDRSKTQIITIIDELYPEPLKQIYDPPVVLYTRGDVRVLQRISVAIVGCRRASCYGLRQAERIAGELSLKGICVVSGMARGIDTAAHKGALAHQGKTVAVLGSGLNQIYPAENKSLFEEIAQSGAVISEFPLAMPPQKENFPKRNRIISGLSRAVVVVEAARRSGSLITANLALEQNRDVCAVPGAANSMNAQGTNKLIKEGAKLVENADDILEELNIPADVQKPDNIKTGFVAEGRRPDINEAGKKLLEFLTHKPLHIDLLVKRSELGSTCVYKNLLELQLKGLVREIEGKMFVLKEGR